MGHAGPSRAKKKAQFLFWGPIILGLWTLIYLLTKRPLFSFSIIATLLAWLSWQKHL